MIEICYEMYAKKGNSYKEMLGFRKIVRHCTTVSSDEADKFISELFAKPNFYRIVFFK